MHNLLEQLESLVRRAGDAILSVRRGAYEVMEKGDQSPVTEADLAAHRILVEGLPSLLDVPVLSEETQIPGWSERSQWHKYWLVDPLDGTREFISGNGEYTVNVALIEGGEPVLGVVFSPELNHFYCGAKGYGAYKNGTSISVRRLGGNVPTVVVSRHFHSQQIVDLVKSRFDLVDIRQIGSSLKFCLIAEGLADFYPRLGPTNEWDTAAAQAVLTSAGGAVLSCDGNELRYNQKSEMLNPNFIAIGDQTLCWMPDLLSQLN
ncbi:3'(2'),5'-bisphosphate nucleotidase CysQ [Porticoccaceae bacterium LTM1]|nr:3'(2'),5'-bisphosphate nucleotidase CysQ [Porticoccaceae bacterium LTM1]